MDPGLLNWANSVRHNMANDPGRQLFKDHVQTHGFSFLDDYLDGIISGRKQDPLIELVKTPGHKKAVSRNPQFTFHSISLDSPGEHIQQIVTFSQISKLIENHNEVPKAPGLQLLNDRDHVMTDIQEEVVEMPQKLMDKPGMSPRQPLLQHGEDEDKTGSTSSMDTFHSIPLDSPGGHLQQIETFPPTSEVSPIENHNEVSKVLALHDRDHVLTDIQEEVVEMPQKLTEKPNPPFPTLPEPMSLRKSMKPPRDPSVNAVLLGAATPVALVGGKRTSWLMKAREAKALDRLSRPPKLAKTSEGETFSFDSTDHPSMKTPGPVNMIASSSTESQSQPPVIVESTQEGFFDRLKKTVEDLGVRVSKTASKSVGSDTATILAEARAAAKAKVAERDRKEEELTMALPAPETVERETAARQENKARLSISDLFPVENSATQATTRISTSTTPPHSPPHSLTIPSVFSKAPPVFVPLIQVATKPITSTVLKSSGQSTKALGFSPRLASSLPKAVPLTTHSTLESIGSDAVFDRDDAPASMPSTQDTEYTMYGSQSQQQNNQILDEEDGRLVDEKLDVPAWMPNTQYTKYTTYDSQSQPQNNRILDEEDNWSVDEKLAASVGVSKDPSQSEGLLSSALGTSKKGKQPEVKKVLQMAAVAAKKQQEEADKKAARLKEMESRRQLAIQRKAEEERANVVEEERKMKEEAQRRKREREELTDKRPIKSAGKKKEDENLKKRRIEAEKKQEIKKPSSVLIGKAHLKSALKPSSASNYKGTTRLEKPVDEVSQPSMLVQSQVAARVKAHINAAKQVVPAIPSENIELPEINSEYSDSEDEDRVRTFDPPEWAQSPELRQALEMQSTMNPEDIFGAVRPLRMEDIFKSRTSRFRARTSSANWTGTDRLTMQEEREYARRMGFK